MRLDLSVDKKNSVQRNFRKGEAKALLGKMTANNLTV